MATFPSIVPVSRTEWTGGNMTSPAPCNNTVAYAASSSPAYPVSSTVTYQPSSVFNFRNDPTKADIRNWKKIKQTGEISFTPLNVWSVRTTNYVVPREYRKFAWKIHQHGCDSSKLAVRVGPLYGQTIYLRNSSIDEYGNSIDSSVYNVKLADLNGLITDAMITTQQDAFAQATSTYDALTEFAELGETLRFMQSFVEGAAEALIGISVTDVDTYKRARSLNAKQMLRAGDRAMQEFGKRWMALRYAITPLCYSLKDASDLISHKASKFKTGRARKKIQITVVPDDYYFSPKSEKVVKIGSTAVTVSSIYKTRYDSGTLQRLVSQVSINPFVTAWELVPLSYVIGWFFNINELIIALTRPDLSSASAGCTAIKTLSVETIHLHDFSEDTSTFSIGAWYNLPAVNQKFTYARSTSQPLQEVITESYKRFLFANPSAELVFDPDLNWKRIIDGLVLSYLPIKKLFRSL